MSTQDAPDWQRVVTTVESTGDVPDAPDWQRIAVGPGGQPVGPQPGGNITSIYYVAGYKAVTVDPMTATVGVAHNDLVMSTIAFTPFVSATVDTVTFIVTTGQVVTANQSYVCIYDQGQATANESTLLGQTAAGVCDSPFATTGIHTVSLSSSVDLAVGEVYNVGFMNLGATPSFAEAPAVTVNTPNPSGISYPLRALYTLSPATTPPTSLAWSTAVLSGAGWLFYLS